MDYKQKVIVSNWRLVAGSAVFMVMIIIVAAIMRQDYLASKTSSLSIDHSVNIYDTSDNSLCDSCTTCMTLTDCRELHGGHVPRGLSRCHRGGFCCPQHAVGEAPRLCHRNYDLLPRPPACGRSGRPTSTRISEGLGAIPGQYPWMALLGTTMEDGQIWWSCGATLINSRYVLTAAHCLSNSKIPIDLVRLREHNLNKDAADDCEGKFCVAGEVEDIRVERLILHEEWLDQTRSGKQTLKNDIALIRLEKEADISLEGSIFPICLPLEAGDISTDPNEEYEIAGWGTTGELDMKFADSLQFQYIRGRSLDECNMCRSDESILCPLAQSQICVQGVRGIDVCPGDSGGPLMAYDVFNTWQSGIVSLNPLSCGTDNIPSIFTNVSAYIPWILDNIDP